MGRKKETCRRPPKSRLPRKSHAPKKSKSSRVVVEKDFSEWLVKDLKEFLIQNGVDLKSIHGTGKNGNPIKIDLVREASKI